MAARNRWWAFAAKLAVTAALLYAVWRMVEGELDGVLAALRGASMSLIFLAFLNHLLGRYLMAWQTGYSMRVYGVFYPAWLMFSINLQTLFYSFLLPGDFGGSAVKWFLIARIEGKRAETLAAMVYIRMVNLMVVLLTGLAALAVRWPFQDRSALVYLLTALALLLGAMLGLHLRITQSWWEWSLASRAAGRLPAGLVRRLDKVHEAFLAIGRYGAREIAVLWGFSFAVKLSTTVSFWLAARALGLDPGFVALLWIHSAVELVQFLPISIAGLGARELTVIYLLGFFGVAEPAALGFSLALFALRLGLVAAGGGFAAWEWFVRRSRVDGG